MLSKKVVKDIQSLALKKYREESGLFVAEGPKTVAELLLEAPEQVKKVYALPTWGLDQKLQNLEIVSPAELEKISALKTPNEVVAVLRQFNSRPPDGSSFALYLDAVQDPGNFGTIIRIADWFDVQDIVCGPGCADLYNPKVVQATMASIARINIYYDVEATWLKSQALPVYAAVLDGTTLYDFPKSDTGVLIIGNESRGISPDTMASASHKITIPKRGRAESLNAAVATGIILSHLTSGR